MSTRPALTLEPLTIIQDEVCETPIKPCWVIGKGDPGNHTAKQRNAMSYLMGRCK